MSCCSRHSMSLMNFLHQSSEQSFLYVFCFASAQTCVVQRRMRLQYDDVKEHIVQIHE